MPDADYNDRLKDYVQVKDRIVALYELYGSARITTTYELTAEPDDKPKVIARALVYRTPDDPHPSTGTSWLYLPGTTPYTRGSEIENAETSAIGRAIGFLGILIDKSIASANEIAGKQDTRPTPEHLPPREGSLIGTAGAGANEYDFELRQAPQGAMIGFKLTQGRQQVRILAYGPLADQIATFREAIDGKTVTCWGTMTQETWVVNKGKPDERAIPYTRLLCSRITGADGFELPLHDEAPTIPLFDDTEDAALDQAIGA